MGKMEGGLFEVCDVRCESGRRGLEVREVVWTAMPMVCGGWQRWRAW